MADMGDDTLRKTDAAAVFALQISDVYRQIGSVEGRVSAVEANFETSAREQGKRIGEVEKRIYAATVFGPIVQAVLLVMLGAWMTYLLNSSRPSASPPPGPTAGAQR